MFYELDELCRMRFIIIFTQLSYSFNHLKIVTSKENRFFSNYLPKSDLENRDFDDNCYFCFSDLNFDPNFIQTRV